MNGSLNSALQTQSNLNTNIPFNKAKGGLKRRELTPSRNPNFMGIGGGDRYIPCRSSTQFEYANHCLVNHNVQVNSYFQYYLQIILFVIYWFNN